MGPSGPLVSNVNIKDIDIAKRLSKSIPSECNKEWENRGLEIMKEVVAAKMEQAPEFKDRLLSTGD